MAFERFAVVVAPFPFVDLSIRKPRPVLVLSNLEFNRGHDHIVGAMITTAARSSWMSDHQIRELESTGLTHQSVVRWKLFTLPISMISKQIGTLGMNDRAAVAMKTAGIFLS